MVAVVPTPNVPRPAVSFITPSEPALVLAPMDGVTDGVMRSVLTAQMPFTYCVTEFVRVAALPVPPQVLRRELPELAHEMRTTAGTPVQLQLLGGSPERLAETARRAVALGVTAVDINFGCPAPTVNRHDGGATLLKFPERIENIVAAVRAAVRAAGAGHLPVSAKLRLGWDDPRAIVENAERAVRGGASWLTIHGRTRMQGYTPPAYWKPIGEVRRAVGVPVVANGEIWSVEDLARCIEESGCQHFMLGRGALADPFLVEQCAQFLGLRGQLSQKASDEERRARWRASLSLLINASQAAAESERRTLSRIKQWLNYAHKRGMLPGDAGSNEGWFARVKVLTSLLEVSEALGLRETLRTAA